MNEFPRDEMIRMIIRVGDAEKEGVDMKLIPSEDIALIDHLNIAGLVNKIVAKDGRVIAFLSDVGKEVYYNELNLNSSAQPL